MAFWTSCFDEFHFCNFWFFKHVSFPFWVWFCSIFWRPVFTQESLNPWRSLERWQPSIHGEIHESWLRLFIFLFFFFFFFFFQNLDTDRRRKIETILSISFLRFYFLNLILLTKKCTPLIRFVKFMKWIHFKWRTFFSLTIIQNSLKYDKLLSKSDFEILNNYWHIFLWKST